jgi:hypothetical protein
LKSLKDMLKEKYPEYYKRIRIHHYIFYDTYSISQNYPHVNNNTVC